MTVKIIRGFFVLACIIMGAIWARFLVEGVAGSTDAPISLTEPVKEPLNQVPWVVLGGAIGAAVSITVLFLLHFVSQEIYERIMPAFVAVVLAMTAGYFIAKYILLWVPEPSANLHINLIASLVLIFGFVGIHFGLTLSAKWESLITAVSRQRSQYGTPKIIDTSVIIDGRIADVWESGFIEGTLLVPRFILNELQHIADSADVLRRAKGRRGLDILKAMQEGPGKLDVVIIDDDPPNIREVDGKLVVVARKHGGKIITNDYNLNKVAQIEGVAVLNINDLANAVKPAVLPDERMEVKIIKEGKEAYQGVGYLDDGTMVVVDGGKDYVGKQVGVVVTSVLQTSAGRMIFSKMSNVLT